MTLTPSTTSNDANPSLVNDEEEALMTVKTTVKHKEEECRHFLQIVQEMVNEKRDTLFASWYDVKGNLMNERSFGRIWDEAGKISHYLRRKWNVEKGQRVILCYDFGLHFFEVFIGCLRAGVMAVLVYPPGPPLQKSLAKLANVVDDCKPALILTDASINRVRALDSRNPLSKTRNLWPKGVPFKVTDKLPSIVGVSPYDEKTNGSDIAFLQYTSGSTGEPKGVMVTYKAIKANTKLLHDYSHQMLRHSGGIPEEYVIVSWLPQYHDLGLILGLIAPFVGGWRLHMISPVSFLRNPLLWLDLISQHRAHWSLGPDFSFQLVTRKFEEAQQRHGHTQPIPGLDLSCVRHLMSTAEPCRPETETRFTQLFSQYGLRPNWYMSGYGLAENVVGVSYIDGQYLSTPRDEDNSKVYVACAKRSNLHSSLEVKVVEPDSCELVKDGVTGELWIAGTSMAAGYFGKPELSEKTFNSKVKQDGNDKHFLRTGDLAFFQNDFLYICGRIKDLIIYNGVNYYPQDIEFAAQDASTAVRPGCVAAFSRNEIEDTKCVELVFEIRGKRAHEAQEVCALVRNAIAQTIGLPLSRVVAIPERTIPKTTSGKIRRRATRRVIHAEELPVVYSLEMQAAPNCDTRKSIGWSNLSGDKRRSFLEPTPSTAVTGGDSSESAVLWQYDDSVDHSVSLEEVSDRAVAIFTSVVGSSLDMSKTWEENGLSSLMSVELSGMVLQELHVTLPVGFEQQYPTPLLLEQFINSSSGGTFPVHLPHLGDTPNHHNSSRSLRVQFSTVLQSFGVLLLLFCFVTSLVPPYYMGKLVADVSTTFEIGRTGRFATWVWIPVIIPAFALSFSILVVLVKWTVVGQYRSRIIELPSLAYLRWWFVDRLVHLWELWVGQFISDTILIVLFYRLLGAKISWRAKGVSGFLREFDLIKIGEGSSVGHTLRCRKFAAWTKERPRLVFRPIEIGKNCTINGTISPGAVIGDGSTVARLSAVAEGARVPSCAIAKGTPAYNAGPTEPDKETTVEWAVMMVIKPLFLGVELLIFYSCLLGAQVTLNQHLPSQWRYTPLLYWFLVLLTVVVFSVAVSVMLKWLLIGRRKPDDEETLYRRCVYWVCDTHFLLASFLLWATLHNSRFWNVVFILHGLDVDLESFFVDITAFPPSKVDLIRIRKSFFSTDIFIESGDRIDVVDSNIGYGVVLSPGISVHRCLVPPRSRVSESLYDESPKQRSRKSFSVARALRKEACHLVLFWLIFFSLIPAYEFFQATANGPGMGLAVAYLFFTIIIQSLVWIILIRLVQSLFVRQGVDAGLYTTYIVYGWALKNFAGTSLLWGTQLFSPFARFMGARVEGELWYHGSSVFDYNMITFGDRTIVDDSHITGHYTVFADLTLGETRVAGVLHPGCYAHAGANVPSGGEYGPRKVFLQSA